MDHFYSFQSFFARFDSQILSRAVELIKTSEVILGQRNKSLQHVYARHNTAWAHAKNIVNVSDEANKKK